MQLTAGFYTKDEFKLQRDALWDGDCSFEAGLNNQPPNWFFSFVRGFEITQLVDDNGIPYN